jgi:Raf kinase inhibitor-like YbhB/YbcL family protein
MCISGRLLRSFRSLLVAAVLLLLFGAGCRSGSEPAALGEFPMSIQLSSPAFTEGNPIPAKYTCDGGDVSPPLAWSGVPEAAKSLALIVDDPDAPVRTWVHWVLYGLSPGLTELNEGLVKSATIEGLGVQGNNDFRKPGYSGPCPPRGKPHRYFYKLYALDTTLSLPAGATKGDLEEAMRGHILAQGQLIGSYSR